MDQIETILTALAPMLTDLLALGLSALLAALMLAVRRYFGIKAQAILRDALNQAVKTGVMQASQSAGKGSVAAQAVEYAKRSSPDAIKALKARDDVLFDKASAVIEAQRY